MTNAERCEFWIRQIVDSTLRLSSRRRAMGGTRIRAGQICCACLAPLPAPHTAGVKRCERCQLPTAHRVFMSFIHRNGSWHCRFLESDLKTPLPMQLTYRDAGKICETALRGHGLPDEASRLALGRVIEVGRGGIWLNLTDKQYQTLKSSKDVNQTVIRGDASNAK